MAAHNELGAKGEKLALHYLIQKGYTILETNYRFKHMEVDILAESNNLLIVVEVKTRQYDYMSGPERTVTRAKQKAIIKVANAYILANDWQGETRFDIISILMPGAKTRIEHLEDAFYPF